MRSEHTPLDPVGDLRRRIRVTDVTAAGSSGADLEATLVTVRQLVDEIITSQRHHSGNGRPLLEHRGSEEQLGPVFSRFLHQHQHRWRPSQVYIAWDSWLGAGRIPQPLHQLESGLLAAGGQVLTLSGCQAAGDQVGSGRLEDLRRRGARVRVHQTELPDTIILERQEAILRGPSEGGRADVYIIRHPVVVDALLRLVSGVWQAALDIEVFRQFSALQDDLTMRVLHLLSTGYKDEAAARELGVSVRTYRRHVANLMGQLDAESRFQAGLRAARLGLSRPDLQRA